MHSTGRPGGEPPLEGQAPTLAQRVQTAPAETGQKLRMKDGPPGGILVKRDANGAVTNYAYYDDSGEIIKRVDLVGRPHGGIPTPHTLEYKTNVAPDGRRFPGPAGSVRPATADEIP